jgi:hypothetical protein
MKTLLQPIIIRVRTTISALMAAKGSLLENRANIRDSIRFLFNNFISETGAYWVFTKCLSARSYPS